MLAELKINLFILVFTRFIFTSKFFLKKRLLIQNMLAELKINLFILVFTKFIFTVLLIRQ